MGGVTVREKDAPVDGYRASGGGRRDGGERGRDDAAGLSGGSDPAPAAILAAWRATERLYAAATPGTDEAADLHAEMRRLMDEYEWRVRGSVPKRVDRPTRRR